MPPQNWREVKNFLNTERLHVILILLEVFSVAGKVSTDKESKMWGTIQT